MNRLLAVGLFQRQLFSVAVYCEHQSYPKLLKDINFLKKARYFQEYEMSYWQNCPITSY